MCYMDRVRVYRNIKNEKYQLKCWIRLIEERNNIKIHHLSIILTVIDQLKSNQQDQSTETLS